MTDGARGHVTVVIGFRATAGSHDRLRNLRGCLSALQHQDLFRKHYRIVLVEQDAEPRCPLDRLPIDEHVFAYNPGPFNRGWGFNVGARSVRGGVLCLLDADLVVPANFISQGLAAWRRGARAIRPYTNVLYLTDGSTQRVLEQLERTDGRKLDKVPLQGLRPEGLEGGCLWSDTELYHELGGHDERFEGWGDEDREFWHRLSQRVNIVTLPGRLLHLNHSRHASLFAEGRANRLLYNALKSGLLPAQHEPIGDVERYRRR